MSASPPSSKTALQAAAGLIASGHAAEAARELNALVRVAPTYAAAYVLLAKAREASGDRVRALDAWHRAYFLVPSSPLVKRERQRLLDALAPPPPDATETAAMPAPPIEVQEPPAETAAPYGTYVAPEPPPEQTADIPEGTTAQEAPDELNGIVEPEAANTEPADTELPEADERAPLVEEADLEEDDSIEAANLMPPLTESEPSSGETPTDEGDDGGWELLQEEKDDTPLAPEAPLAPELLSPGDSTSTAPETGTSGADGPEISDATELTNGAGLDNDLDALIRDLEDAPRIRPDPNFAGPNILASEAETDEIASETLAQIYAAQKLYTEAADVYETLARQRPERAEEMLQKAESMRQRS